MSDDLPLQTTIWRHIRVDHPAAWEMLRYSKNPQAGRCSFADRYQYRLELSWQTFAAAPDFDRMVSDYAASLRKGHEDANVRPINHGDWHGLESADPAVTTTRFGRYFSDLSCLIELVFVWPDDKDQPLIDTVLQSVEALPPKGGQARWRALGMDLNADDGLALAECRAEPAAATMTFADDRHRKRNPMRRTFQRFGMVEHWLTMPLSQWLTDQAPAPLIQPDVSQLHHAGHDFAVLQGAMKRTTSGPYSASLWSRMRGRSLHFQSAAWLCPADGRLYHAQRAGLPDAAERINSQNLPPLRCCQAFTAP